MKNKGLTAAMAAALIIAVVQLAAAFIGIGKLPDSVPLHFNALWECDMVGSAWGFGFIAALPLIAAVVALVMVLTGKMKQPKITMITVLLTEAYMIGLFWMMYPMLKSGVQLGDKVDAQPFAALLPLMISAMFVIFGNYMPIIQPNKTIGFRIVWTLENPQCWRRTHRFTGRIWVITGLIMTAIALISLALHQGGKLWVTFIVIGITLLNVVIPGIYAYLHRNDK